jgi:hypothetical protein
MSGSVRENANNRFFVKQFSSTTEQEFHLIASHLQRSEQLRHGSLIRLISTKSNVESAFCSHSSSCLAVFDYYSDTLKEELQQRFYRMH